MAERPARRRKPSKSVEQLKAEINDRETAAAKRREERKASKKSLSPAEKYEQEKAARAKKGSSGYSYSQHLMGGSGSSSSFNPRSVREEVLSYLLDEGFASDEKSAEAIMGAMSEEWKQSIIEASEEDRERLKKYEVRFYQKKGGMPADPEKRRELRDAARRLPPA